MVLKVLLGYASSAACSPMSPKKLGDVLPLKIFIRKAQVLQLYRSMLRCLREIDDIYVQVDIKKQIISGFRENISLTSDSHVAQAIQEGHHHLKTLSSMAKRQSIAEGSWLQSGTETDEKGRVGEGWPWHELPSIFSTTANYCYYFINNSSVVFGIL